MAFFQEPPELGSAFADDRPLRSWLRRVLPEDVQAEVHPSLERMGELAAGLLLQLSLSHRLDEPRHVPFDPWGNRVDRVEVNAAWHELSVIAAREGVVGTAFERRHGPFSRVHQFALVFLFAPSSQTYDRRTLEAARRFAGSGIDALTGFDAEAESRALGLGELLP